MVASTLKWGVLIGLATYLVVDVALTAIGLLAFGSGAGDLTANPGKLTLGCAGLFLLLFAFSAAGFFAGRETARSGAGALAGLVAGAIYAVLIQVYTPGGSGFGASSGAATGIVATIVVFLITAVLYLGVAALMGWLGGRPGSQRSPLRVKAAVPAPEAGKAPPLA